MGYSLSEPSEKIKRKVAAWRADEEALLCNFLTVIQYTIEGIYILCKRATVCVIT